LTDYLENDKNIKTPRSFGSFFERNGMDIRFIAISAMVDGHHEVNHLPIALIDRLLAARRIQLTPEEQADPTIAVRNTIQMALEAQLGL
jgi:hypothetical protein